MWAPTKWEQIYFGAEKGRKFIYAPTKRAHIHLSIAQCTAHMGAEQIHLGSILTGPFLNRLNFRLKPANLAPPNLELSQLASPILALDHIDATSFWCWSNLQ